MGGKSPRKIIATSPISYRQKMEHGSWQSPRAEETKGNRANTLSLCVRWIKGKTWIDPVDVEPANGPEASYAGAA